MCYAPVFDGQGDFFEIICFYITVDRQGLYQHGKEDMYVAK